MKRLLVLSLLIGLLGASLVVAQYAPDSDGDGVTDDQDICHLEPGPAETGGCPADVLATFPDSDGDGVPDPLDSCFEPGLAENDGCPAGIEPDYDGDGIPNGADACPRRYGVAANNGCPADDDGDLVANENDACPDQPGTFDNLGCPDGVMPPDDDGDGVPNLFDNCLDLPGTIELGGCPDSDGDFVIDAFDQCPDVPGDPNLSGCAPVFETTFPRNRSGINVSSAASIEELGRLTVGPATIDLSGSGLLAVRAPEQLLIYDLTRPPIAPLGSPVTTQQSGYPVAINTMGTLTALYEFTPDFSAPFITLRDAGSGEQVLQYGALADGAAPLGPFDFSRALTLPGLAVAYGTTQNLDSDSGRVIIYGEGSDAPFFTLITPSNVNYLSFSGDGRRLGLDTAVGDNMQIRVYDVSQRGNPIETDLPLVILSGVGTPNFDESVRHFLGLPHALNGDGTRLVMGNPFGGLAIFDLRAVAPGDSPQPIVTASLFDPARSEAVSAVAFSPDGTLVAVAGGVPFSGGLTGQESFPILIIDAETGDVLTRLEGHRSFIRQGSLMFNSDGSLLISAADATIRFWGVR